MPDAVSEVSATASIDADRDERGASSFVNEAAVQRLRAFPKNAAWKVWGAMAAQMVGFFGILAVGGAVSGRIPLLRRAIGSDGVLDRLVPAIATILLLSALITYVRNVVRGPRPNGRIEQRLRARLLAGTSASDPDRFLAETVLFLDAIFLLTSAPSWALAEGSALITGIHALLRGFQPAGIAAAVLSLVLMACSAPTAARRDRHRRRLLRVAGLDDTQVELLLGGVHP